MKNWISIFSLLFLFGCASVTPVASVAGAVFSGTTMYYTVRSSDAKYTVISQECIWYRVVKLSEEGKTGLTRNDKEQIAENNINYDKNCKVKQ